MLKLWSLKFYTKFKVKKNIITSLKSRITTANLVELKGLC